MPRPLSRSGRGPSRSALAGNWRRVSGGKPWVAGAGSAWVGGMDVAVAGRGVTLGAADGVAPGITVAGAVGAGGAGVIVAWRAGRVLVGVTVGLPGRAHPPSSRTHRQMEPAISFLRMLFSLQLPYPSEQIRTLPWWADSQGQVRTATVLVVGGVYHRKERKERKGRNGRASSLRPCPALLSGASRPLRLIHYR